MNLNCIDFIEIDQIEIQDGRRPVQPEAVVHLAASIAKLGLRTPITVRQNILENTVVLISGAHRLEAAKQLGLERIPCFVLGDEPEEQARLWEIAENLHRAELTVIERSEHIAEWMRLTGEVQSAQLGPIKSKREDGRGHRHKSGVNAVVRELGVKRSEAQRSIRIASLSPEAKATAREVGLANNQSMLLVAAREPRERQESSLREFADRREAKLVSRGVAVPGGTSHLAVWILTKAHPFEIPAILSWLETEEPKDVTAALRRSSCIASEKTVQTSGHAVPSPIMPASSFGVVPSQPLPSRPEPGAPPTAPFKPLDLEDIPRGYEYEDGERFVSAAPMEFDGPPLDFDDNSAPIRDPEQLLEVRRAIDGFDAEPNLASPTAADVWECEI
ncbi:MAG: ParB N-terminal domain-containing protein [Methylocella sp.]